MKICTTTSSQNEEQLKGFNNRNIILFDGVCNLCHGFVQFVIRNEKNNDLEFGSLQSPVGKKVLGEFNVQLENLDTIVFITNNKVFLKSSAVFQIFKFLKIPYSYFDILHILPLKISNYFYDKIAKNRYSFFGKRQTCWIPTEKLKSKFIS